MLVNDKYKINRTDAKPNPRLDKTIRDIEKKSKKLRKIKKTKQIEAEIENLQREHTL